MQTIRLIAINCGFFIAPADFFVNGAGTDKWRGPVPAFLIDHPRGKVLFDVGLNKRFQDYMAVSPSAAAGYGVEFNESQQIDQRLRAFGVDPAEINYIALSHLHHDHCAGLSQIPNATLLIQREEYDFAMANDGNKYDSSYFSLGHPVKKVDGEFDVFGDGTLTLFPTPGHTPGHQSARVRLASGDVILAADCCYVGGILDDFNKLSPGSHDREEHFRSLQLLRDLRSGGSRIIGGHDPAETILTAQTPSLVV
jgi:glyoxylase-like metal-dependent hydrolase (beta-lactamase superfamily II)